MNTHRVVCGFNGTTYSSHRSLSAAMKSKARNQRVLFQARPQTGSLASHVQVVAEGATFGRIHCGKNGEPQSYSANKWSEVIA
jgi:hypothetical protein